METQTSEQFLVNKIIDWQNGETLRLGAREKGNCVALLYDKIVKLSEEVEQLKAKIGGDL